MNWGLSEKIKAAFPNLVPVDRPLVIEKEIPSPHWVAGFSSGEACFYIGLNKSKTLLSEIQVLLTFSLTQHFKDKDLLERLISYFECGRYSLRKNKLAGDLEVTKIFDLSQKIIPFFLEYPIEGVKHQDFLDFLSVVELIKTKAHLTNQGLEEIKKIKSGMNKSRLISSLNLGEI